MKVGENKRRERGEGREGAPHLSGGGGMGEGRNIGTANTKRGGGGGGRGEDQGVSPPKGLNSSKYPTSPAFTSRRSNGDVGVANLLGSSTNGGGRRGEESSGNSKKEGRAEEGGWRSVGGSGTSILFCLICMMDQEGCISISLL